MIVCISSNNLLTTKEGNLKLRTEDKDPYYSRYKQQVNIAVSPELYKAFKSKCAGYGYSMTAVMTDYMLRFIDQQDQEVNNDR